MKRQPVDATDDKAASSNVDNIHTLILISIIAYLVLALLMLLSPDANLSLPQFNQMPLVGP